MQISKQYCKLCVSRTYFALIDLSQINLLILGQMPWKKTLNALHVKTGNILTLNMLNCTCLKKTNGQWSGPNTTSFFATDHFIPYKQGTESNQGLNKSKYMVFGGYDDKICYNMIKNFTSDDDGIYICVGISARQQFT